MDVALVAKRIISYWHGCVVLVSRHIICGWCSHTHAYQLSGQKQFQETRRTLPYDAPALIKNTKCTIILLVLLIL